MSSMIKRLLLATAAVGLVAGGVGPVAQLGLGSAAAFAKGGHSSDSGHGAEPGHAGETGHAGESGDAGETGHTGDTGHAGESGDAGGDR
jgi:hypothetical protein